MGINLHQIPDEFRQCAVTKLPWEKTEYTPKATGIPPHMILMAEVHELHKKFDELRVSIRDDVRNALDTRLHNINSAEYHTNRIIEAISESTRKMDEIIAMNSNRNASSADGYGVDNGDDVDDVTDDFFVIEDEGIVDERSLTEKESAEEQSLRLKRNLEQSSRVVKKRKLTIGYHHGKLCMLPPHWDFPSMNTKQLFESWLLPGNKGFPPYSQFTDAFVSHIPRASQKLRQMRATMSIIERWAKEKNCWVPGPSWKIREVNQLWSNVESNIYALLKSNRKCQLSWKTVFNKMSAAELFPNSKGKGKGRGTTKRIVNSANAVVL